MLHYVCIMPTFITGHGTKQITSNCEFPFVTTQHRFRLYMGYTIYDRFSHVQICSNNGHIISMWVSKVFIVALIILGSFLGDDPLQMLHFLDWHCKLAVKQLVKETRMEKIRMGIYIKCNKQAYLLKQ